MFKLEKLKKYFLLYLGFVIYSLVTVFAKMASSQIPFSFLFMLFIGMEIICLGLYAIVWQQSLKNFTLITAMASKGIVVIISMLWAILFFNEKITIGNIIGTAFIIVGIWMVSRYD